MSIPQSIIQKDKELLELVFKKNQLINSSKGSVVKHKKIESKIKLIKHELFLLLDKYLMGSDAEYGEIAKQNLVLFANPSVRVKVTSEDYSIMGSYSRGLEGKINTNGYSYGKSSLTNIDFVGFQKYMYPKEFRGQIDHWGNYKVRISKRGFALFKTTPQKFEVLIEDNGLIQFTTTERGWDLTRGSKTIGKLFANHFGKNEFKKKQFEANKKKLFVVIKKLKEEFHLYMG